MMSKTDSVSNRFSLAIAASCLAIAAFVGLRFAAAEDATPPESPAASDKDSSVIAEQKRVEGRIGDLAKFLSSDELEGRGVGTKGLDRAAERIAKQFQELGLKTDVVEGTPFQKFTVTSGAKLVGENTLELLGPAGEDGKPTQTTLKIREDFMPLAVGGSGRVRLPIAFAGYGITSTQANYDDFAKIDAKNKAVIMLRREPQQNNPHSVFDGTRETRHAAIRAKISNAYQHGAAAVILVSDQADIDRRTEAARKRWQIAVDDLVAAQKDFASKEKPTTEESEAHFKKVNDLATQIAEYAKGVAREADPVMDFNRGGDDPEGREIPVFHVRRGVIDPVIKAVHGKSLAEIEAEIDKGPTPQSFELDGWQTLAQTNIERETAPVKNVIAVLEGEGPTADETIIIGAHYDHLGLGGPGAADPGVVGVRNGADDNASGAATLVEIARQFAIRGEKLPRRLVFIAFSGEERGLLGSAYYVKHPTFPLDKTVAMLNLDMVGRLQDNSLIVSGSETAKEFSAWLDELNAKLQFKLVKKPSGFGPSDHATFYAEKMPVLHFFTGLHPDYHKASDDFEKLDISGMRRIGDYVVGMTDKIARNAKAPEFIDAPEQAGPIAGSGGDRPYFGTIPDFASNEKGYAISGAAQGGPADRGGLKRGDVIIKFGDNQIGNLEDIDGALRKYKAGDKVEVVVRRAGADVKLEVTLDPPK